MPLRSPIRWLIRISKLIQPKQNFCFSLQKLLFSKSSPTESRASHRHSCSGQKPKNPPQFLSSLYTPLESINTHLSKHILNLPSLPQPPVITHLILDSLSKSLLAGLSIVYCPRITTVIFLEHESGHMLPSRQSPCHVPLQSLSCAAQTNSYIFLATVLHQLQIKPNLINPNQSTSWITTRGMVTENWGSPMQGDGEPSRDLDWRRGQRLWCAVPIQQAFLPPPPFVICLLLPMKPFV